MDEFAGMMEEFAGMSVFGDRGRNSTLRYVPAAQAAALVWQQAQEQADQVITTQIRKVQALRRQRASISADLVLPLASLITFCESTLSCPSVSAVGGVAVGLLADYTGAVDDDGLVDSSSLLFRVIVALDSLAVPGPHQAFMALLEDPQTEVLLKGLCLLTVGGPGIGYSGVIGSDTGPAENSSLNFEVRAVAASGQSVPQVLAAVDRLQGLPAAKAAFRGIVAREQMTLRRSRAGLNGPIPARHYVFAGNPGTGKTTVARLLVDVLHASGTMPDAHLVETNRADLVGEFVGSSALKTRKMVEAALGGVLFIDEAYALAGYGTESPDRFAQEAVDTLVKLMEDYRDDLVVVLAGYPEQMSRMLAMNPGLRSRISRILVFDDLDDDQLVDTFTTQVIDAGYRPGPDVEVLVRAVLAATVRDESFGNARWTRNLLEAAIEAHALRLLDLPDAEDQDLQTLTFADVQQAAAAL